MKTDHTFIPRKKTQTDVSPGDQIFTEWSEKCRFLKNIFESYLPNGYLLLLTILTDMLQIWSPFVFSKRGKFITTWGNCYKSEHNSLHINKYLCFFIIPSLKETIYLYAIISCKVFPRILRWYCILISLHL